MSVVLLKESFDGFLGRRVPDITLDAGQSLHVDGVVASDLDRFYEYLNGSRKSRSGSKFFFGRDASNVSIEGLHRLGVVFASGHRKIFPSLTIEDHIVLRLQGMGQSIPNRKQLLAESISRFPSLRGSFQTPTGNLSGGQQQMAMLVSAMVGSPSVLIIQEPFLGLFIEARRNAAVALRGLVAAGTSLILIEQQRSVELEWFTSSLRFDVDSLIMQDGRPTAEL